MAVTAKNKPNRYLVKMHFGLGGLYGCYNDSWEFTIFEYDELIGSIKDYIIHLVKRNKEYRTIWISSIVVIPVHSTEYLSLSELGLQEFFDEEWEKVKGKQTGEL